MYACEANQRFALHLEGGLVERRACLGNLNILCQLRVQYPYQGKYVYTRFRTPRVRLIVAQREL